MITRFVAQRFTAFEKLDMSFSNGINVFIGENGTGKTHIIKAIYAACAVIDSREKQTFADKLESVFLPNSIGRLVHRQVGGSTGRITVYRREAGETSDRHIVCTITSKNKAEVSKNKWIEDKRNPATFIPVKDMLANAPGFRALYSTNHIHFEEIYADIIDKALLPIPKGKAPASKRKLLNILREAVSGRVIEKNEQFYLKNKAGELEFTLLAEGFRKLGLLYTLIQNDALMEGSILFWDEPEANLNPKLARTVVKILFELQKMGVQIFVTTHNYAFLKEFDLEADDKSRIQYYSMFRLPDASISYHQSNTLDDLMPNSIDEAFSSILDREISKGLKL